MFVRGGHTNSREKTRSERQRRKGKIYQLNAEFQRLARRDKKASLSEQCKETEETIEWDRLKISSESWRYQSYSFEHSLALPFFGILHSNGYIFPFLLCLSLFFFSQLFIRSPQTTILPFCISFSCGWFDPCLLYNVMNLHL